MALEEVSIQLDFGIYLGVAFPGLTAGSQTLGGKVFCFLSFSTLAL